MFHMCQCLNTQWLLIQCLPKTNTKKMVFCTIYYNLLIYRKRVFNMYPAKIYKELSGMNRYLLDSSHDIIFKQQWVDSQPRLVLAVCLVPFTVRISYEQQKWHCICYWHALCRYLTFKSSTYTQYFIIILVDSICVAKNAAVFTLKISR